MGGRGGAQGAGGGAKGERCLAHRAEGDRADASLPIPPVWPIHMPVMTLVPSRSVPDAPPAAAGPCCRSLTEGGATSTPFYFSGGMPGTVCPELPTWPGQVPPLVDIFGYEDIPRKHLLALIDLVDQLQQVVTQRDAVLGLLLPGGSSSTGAPRSSSSSQGGSGTGVSQLVTSGDLHQLLEVAECYVALNVAYDKVRRVEGCQEVARWGLGGHRWFASR